MLNRCAGRAAVLIFIFNTIHTPDFSIHTGKDQLPTGKNAQRLNYINLYLCKSTGIVIGNQSCFCGSWCPMFFL